MDEGWERTGVGAVAALGALVLGLFLIMVGALLVAHGGGWGWIVLCAGCFCWVASLRIVARRSPSRR